MSVIKRIKSVDELRGFAIGAMILVNFLAIYSNTPNILKHASGVSYTFADVVAPLLMFEWGVLQTIGMDGIIVLPI